LRTSASYSEDLQRSRCEQHAVTVLQKSRMLSPKMFMLLTFKLFRTFVDPSHLITILDVSIVHVIIITVIIIIMNNIFALFKRLLTALRCTVNIHNDSNINPFNIIHVLIIIVVIIIINNNLVFI